MTVDINNVVLRLQGIEDELSEASMSILGSELHEAEPSPDQLSLEKRITRARRSIRKATVLLDPSIDEGL